MKPLQSMLQGALSLLTCFWAQASQGNQKAKIPGLHQGLPHLGLRLPALCVLETGPARPDLKAGTRRLASAVLYPAVALATVGWTAGIQHSS